jgi:gamma-glutamyl hercynylcysteine S-oxide synthase
MHEASLNDAAVGAPARLARQGGVTDLAAALQASRADTLATFATFQAALPPGLTVPLRAELNPPLWELGHIGWFQEYWLERFPARGQGSQADPEGPRRAPRRANADALYHSSLVPHHSRWALPLPDADSTRADLQAQLHASLSLLQQVDDQGPACDDALYAFRLALLHEDMHHEAALYMAQSLGIAIADPRWQPTPLPEPPAALQFEPGVWRLGSPADAGFAFDNELAAHEVVLPATTIDAQVLRWAEYLPFIEHGGHADERCWSAPGLQWRRQQPSAAPRYLRWQDGAWQQWRSGRWQALDLRLAACHLSFFEAEAWCRWAGRRLPSEAEWERAACQRSSDFRWGEVWEWTASTFAPYPGFTAHPYRDYSAPWFDGRPVLRGASFMTQPRLRHPRYRNYFPPQRNDVPAGLRSCAM